MNSDHEKITFHTGEENTSVPKRISTDVKNQTIVKRKSPIISFSSGKKRKRRFSPTGLIMPLFAFFIAYLLICVYVEKRIAPEIGPLAKAQAQKHLQATVNAAVGEMAKKGDLNYEKMVRTVRGESGEVIYLEVNTAQLAEAKAMLVKQIEESLENNKKITVSVPFGSITGWNLFSGFGIPVKVRVFPIGMTQGEIYTVLEDCGINQTRHLIQVTVKAEMMVVLPEENTFVETEVVLPLGERVLVGDVPEIYLDNIGAS